MRRASAMRLVVHRSSSAPRARTRPAARARGRRHGVAGEQQLRGEPGRAPARQQHAGGRRGRRRARSRAGRTWRPRRRRSRRRPAPARSRRPGSVPRTAATTGSGNAAQRAAIGRDELRDQLAMLRRQVLAHVGAGGEVAPVGGEQQHAQRGVRSRASPSAARSSASTARVRMLSGGCRASAARSRLPSAPRSFMLSRSPRFRCTARRPPGHLAGDVSRRVGAQERHRVRAVLRLGQAARAPSRPWRARRPRAAASASCR